ncbi:UvrD-helicase domain-containing protein [candidate division KSB1 bacterium]
MKDIEPKLPQEYGNDKLIPQYIRIPRILSYLNDPDDPSQIIEILMQFDKNAKPVQKEWIKTGHFIKEDVLEEAGRWGDFRETVVTPILNLWYGSRYKLILEIMFAAQDVYDKMKANRSQLNFQDLLMNATFLLKENTQAREYFQRRFTHLLVDEFQDTDPIQAEMMLLLTASDPKQNDWRKCVPKPGSLFVVGDPKQSIYRFRRADISIYNEMKEIIRHGDGKSNEGLVIQLSANFRTTQTVLDWVNKVFEPSSSNSGFPDEDSEFSPSYVSLQKGREDGKTGSVSGVYVLTIPEELSKKELAVDYEADRIAKTIRTAIDEGATLTRTSQQLTNGMSEKITPSDFMIITKKKADIRLYSRKLNELSIPNKVVGGSTLKDNRELKLLYQCLCAVINPNDPISLVAVLRSELFGISDAALYEFKKYGGAFSFLKNIPEELSETTIEIFQIAFTCLQKYSLWISKIPPLAAIEKIAHNLCLIILAGAKDGGEIEAGSFLKAIEILRDYQFNTWSIEQIVKHLGELVEEDKEFNGVSARTKTEPSVTIINLHKAKGLEAPIVFLANPFGESKHRINIHIDRQGKESKGYMAFIKEISTYNKTIVAQAPDWDVKTEIEEKFLEAEKLRLRYVAATRAGSALIITMSAAGKSKRFSPWKTFEESLLDNQEIMENKSIIMPENKMIALSEEEVIEASKRINERLPLLLEPTYSIQAAKDYSLDSPENGEEFLVSVFPSKSELSEKDSEDSRIFGPDWGSAIHRILELTFKHPFYDIQHSIMKTLEEHSLDNDLYDMAFELINNTKNSQIWDRARKSGQSFSELPFQIPLEDQNNVVKMIRGSIDLIFKEGNEWILVDYKTDFITKENYDITVNKYLSQIKIYSDAFKKCTGEKVKDNILFFL